MPAFKNNSKNQNGSDEKALIGSGLGFAAKEAYKLLRTNLMFALSDVDVNRGYIVGVTSALRGEGKSTTTLNLACVLAEQGKRVVVVEGDLRLPSLRKKLKMNGHGKEGLSHVLIGRRDPIGYVRKCQIGVMDGNPVFFDLLPAGEVPPNPSELLGSRRMEDTLKVLAERYDYVLLDLPPVTAVSDALVATKLVDGVVMVVRNEYSDTGSLNEAIRQLRQVGGKILGFALTYADGAMGGYRYRGKYKYKYKYRYQKYYNYGEYK